MKPFKHLLIITMVATCALLVAPTADAQCPMCKMSAESNLKNGGTAGRGLNAGILYMLALPYALVGTIGYVWWRNNRKRSDEFEDEVEVLP
jgi:hypothetical protein